MCGIRKGLAVLGTVSLLAAGGAVATATAAFAWDVGATASADCSSKGTVVINGSFTNHEPNADGDMNVTMKLGSKSDGPTRVNHQQMGLFTIDTGESSVPAGSVTYLETWVNRSGSDQKTAAFSAKSCSQPESKKVFVCKYVGTPGTDERLQTGNNPISVSWKQGDRVPGDWFNDKHDRSYVLAWDTGQPEPDVSLCPAPEGPPPVTKVNVPASPATVDACNPAGVTDNVAWKNPLPADTDQVNWSESSNGNTRTASLKGENVEWSDGTKAPKVFTLPDDSGVKCEVPVTKVPLPADQESSDACNPPDVMDNVSWKGPLPADTDQVNWSESSNGKTRTASLKGEHVEWADGTTADKTWNLPADSGVECDVVAPKVSLSSECEVVDGSNSGVTVVDATVDNTGSNVEVPFELSVTVDSVTEVYPIPVEPGMVHIPQLFFSPEDGKSVSLVLTAPGATTATLSFETATCVGTVPPPPTTKVTAANGHFGDKCGTTYNLTFTPAVTKGVTYVQVREGNTLTVHAVAQEGYKLSNPLWTQSMTDKLVACPVTVVHKPPTTTKPPVAHKPPAKHVVPGSGAPHTGGAGDGDTRNGLAAIALMALAGGALVLRRRWATNA
jgi:hypothetical protein